MIDLDLSTVDYLKSEALYTSAASPSAVAWGDRAAESEVISPLYNVDDADLEAARQAAFLAGPLVEDTVLVAGARRDLMLKPVSLLGSRLGYETAKTAFVIGFKERDDGMTELSVVRSLP